MSQTTTATRSAPATDGALEPLPPELTTIQPGGGTVMRLELAWGYVRRMFLTLVAPGYVERMQSLRKGTLNPTPHEVIDSRDMKFYVNQPGGYYWAREDDPFAVRDLLPFARWGLAELLVFTTGGAFVTILFLAPAQAGLRWGAFPTWLSLTLAVLALLSAVVTGLLIYFFRDPKRQIPTQPGQVVSPADGTVAAVEELDHHPFIGGPAVRIGIFLSIFNVHVNRWPLAARVVGIDYKAGKYLNAINPRSALENEQLHVRLETTDPADGPPRRMVIHLIAGLIARRIVCILKPGDALPRGQRIGMIKLGSRTELLLPKEPTLTVHVKIGQRVHGGATVLADYSLPASGADLPATADRTAQVGSVLN